MPIKLKPPLIKDEFLEKSDKHFGIEPPEPPTTIKIRQAAQGEEESRNSLFNLTQKKYESDGTISFYTKLGMEDVWKEEVFQCLMDCNILDDAGNKLFKFDKNGRLTSREEFYVSWSKLDPFIADEIIEKIHDLNAQWGPQGGA